MSVARKSAGTFAAYDPVARWTARAWAAVAYLAVFTVIAGIVLFAVRYQPLSTANFASGLVRQSDAKTFVVEYADGETFSFGFLLVNDGPLPVKIQEIQMSGRNEPLLPVKIETAAKRYAGRLGEGDGSLDRFLPFTLAGGDRRWIVVRTEFANCDHFEPGAFQTYTRFQVTYTALAFTKHAWVALPKDVRVDLPSASACP